MFSVVSSVQSLSVHLCSVIAGWSRCSLGESFFVLELSLHSEDSGLDSWVTVQCIDSYKELLIASYLSSRGKHHVCNVKVQLIKKNGGISSVN